MGEKNFGQGWTKGDGGLVLLGAQSNASAALVGNGQYSPLIVEENGGLKVNASVSLGANSSVNVNQIGGVSVATAGSGIQKVGLADGSGNGITSTSNAIDVNIKSGSSAGVQYMMDVTTASATGNLGLGYDGSILRALLTDSTGRQMVDVSRVGGNTAATAAAGVLSVGINSNGNSVNIGQVGGNTVITASAGVQRMQCVSVDETQTIFSSGLAKKPIFLQISASASGSNVLVASAASTTYRILAYNLMANGAVNAQFLSSATPMGGITYCPTAGVGKVAPYCPVGWMETTAGHSLNLQLSANIAVGGELVYIAI